MSTTDDYPFGMEIPVLLTPSHQNIDFNGVRSVEISRATEMSPFSLSFANRSF